MAKEARKLQRAQARANDSGTPSDKPGLLKPGQMPDPGAQLKTLVSRLAIPVVGGWVLCGSIAMFVYSTTAKWVLIGIPTVVTLLAAGLLIFALNQAKKARGVASILGKVETDEDRKVAIAELEVASKKNDTAAIFAKAQLELQ